MPMSVRAVVKVGEMEGQRRPRYTNTPGVGAIVRSPGAATGLSRMGVHMRSVAPGFAGTNRHFHTVEEEWLFVLKGEGTIRIGPLALPIRAGHFAGFPPGPCPHHVVNDGDAEIVFLEGGETRPDEDGCWYPDARIMSEGRKRVEPYREPPPEVGDVTQLVHIDELPIVEFQHDVDAGARRRMRALHRPTGLKRQAVYWAEVAAGDRSTAFHTHDRTDEWVYILSGTAVLDLGDEQIQVGPDVFIGHPAQGPEHVMQATTDLRYLMGGMIDAADIVTYPRHGTRRVAGKLEPLKP